MKAPASFICSIFLGFVSIAQLARFLMGIEVRVGGFEVPPIWSLVAAVFLAILAERLWRERKSSVTKGNAA